VVGISSDSVDSHKSFCSDLDLPFTLLSDEGDAVRKAYGVPTDLLGLLPGRVTYVIGKDGVVKLVFNNQFAPEKHVKEAIAALSPVRA
jgi:thioredoxin-dependent peroxiredoxin